MNNWIFPDYNDGGELVFEPDEKMTKGNIQESVLQLILENDAFARESAIRAQLVTQYPRFGYTTAEIFENEEEYKTWLEELWNEERDEYIELAIADIVKFCETLDDKH